MSKFKVGDRVNIVRKTFGVPESTVSSFGDVEMVRDGAGDKIVSVLHDDIHNGSRKWEHYGSNIVLAQHANNEASWRIISHHYTENADGKDFLQRFFENSTSEEVKGAMVFTMGKYIERLGKKDAVEKELGKIIDYAARYRDFLTK